MNQRPAPAAAPAIPASAARRALTILGDRWTLLILRDAFLGVRQFSAWQARLGVTPTVLTKRLKRLCDEGVFERARFREVPPRVEYRLTAKGFDIYSIALMIVSWEQRWFPEKQRLVLRHTRCGHTTEPRCTCGSCGNEVTAREVGYRGGPGAGVETMAEQRIRRASITADDRRARQGFLEHAVDIFGDRWTWEIIGAAFLGRRRFDEIQANTGMASNILSDRLRRLIADGILARRVYQERPLRHEYVFTERGRDLYASTLMLLRWGDRWLSGDKGVPLLLTHKVCGKPLSPQVTCSICHAALDPHEMTYELADGSVASERPLARA
jgi:DNA-binding HxlR family transcriptional regulator